MALRQPNRRTTMAGRLARLGFAEPERAQRLLAAPELGAVAEDSAFLDALSAAPDPDLALLGLDRMLSAGDCDELLTALANDGTVRTRLLAVLGYSAALGDHLARYPDDWRILAGPEGGEDGETAPGDTRAAAADAGEAGEAGEAARLFRAALLRAVGADPDSADPRASTTGPSALDALRVTYHRELLRLAALDLTAVTGLAVVATRLAELAAGALEAALAVARAELPGEADACRLAVIGMGKCGGRELNYASDVDVVFVAEPGSGAGGAARDEAAALHGAGRLAATLIRACSETTSEGTLWPVDAGLRPEGRNGPLVRTLASHTAYYEQWAKTWEFQALLKARPVAGDPELGEQYVQQLTPMVWRAVERENFVTDVQEMRQRVERQVPRAEAARQLKLGAGGLRDIEFAVQLLQLVHGRADETLRSPNTLAALEALSAGGYVGREDASSLADAYRFLRSLEHLLQLHRLRRIHVLPSDTTQLRRIGRAFGLHSDPVNELTAMWQRHAREARRLHEKLFYRPLLLATARLPSDEARLTPQAARARLEALGYADPAGALRHIEALSSGVSRRAAIQRTLLPVMLGWFADAADPDAGLLGFRKVSEALGSTPWYLRLLRDAGAAAERMAYLLASSRYVTELLLRAPEAVSMLGDEAELEPRTRDALRTEMLAASRRHDTAEAAAATLRALRRHELLRVAMADLLDFLDVSRVPQALTDIAAATVEAALDTAASAVAAEGGSAPARLAVIGMGSFGGAEMGYGSDADVMFVYEPDHPQPSSGEAPDQRGREPGVQAARGAHAVAERLRRLLGASGPDPGLTVDPDLRPEGKDGPLVRTLASYRTYYAHWASAWERQALLRAAPVAGDRDLGERFREAIDPVRYPKGGVREAELREIRRLKARMESERLPRGADPTTHVKLGRGGLSDVEWAAQLLQLQHAAEVPALRTGGTLAVLEAAVEAGLLDRADADALAEGWRSAARVRAAAMLVRGRATDVVPTGVRERSAVARVLGYPPERVGELLEDYRRVTRRARAVVERIFFQ